MTGPMRYTDHEGRLAALLERWRATGCDDAATELEAALWACKRSHAPPPHGTPAVLQACDELAYLAGEVQAWARAVERGEASAGPDECAMLRDLVRALSRAADTVCAVAAAERDQGQALPDGVAPFGRWMAERGS